MNDERKQAEEDLAREEKTERVTLAIAEKSAELAWGEGYRCAVRDIAFWFIVGIVLSAIANGMFARE
jgi:hypothetical protein